MPLSAIHLVYFTAIGTLLLVLWRLFPLRPSSKARNKIRLWVECILTRPPRLWIKCDNVHSRCDLRSTLYFCQQCRPSVGVAAKLDVVFVQINKIISAASKRLRLRNSLRMQPQESDDDEKVHVCFACYLGTHIWVSIVIPCRKSK